MIGENSVILKPRHPLAAALFYQGLKDPSLLPNVPPNESSPRSKGSFAPQASFSTEASPGAQDDDFAREKRMRKHQRSPKHSILYGHRVRIHRLLSGDAFKPREQTAIVRLVRLKRQSAFLIAILPGDADKMLL